MSALISIHLLAAVIWVGGMFFAYAIMRPASAELQPPARLAIWARGLGRFFVWVWAAVILLPVTGYWMIGHFGGMANSPPYINLMQGLGWIMILLFFHVFFAPYRRLKRAVANDDQETASRQLDKVRLLVGINLVLGLIVVVVGAGGRYLS